MEVEVPMYASTTNPSISLRGFVLLLCCAMLLGGCVQSYDTTLQEYTTYPCADLAKVEARYESLKQAGSSENDLRALRRHIRTLQQRCAAYRSSVERYVEEHGNTREDAERKAAVRERSAPLQYTSHPDTGTWLTVGVITGIVILGVGGYFAYAIILGLRNQVGLW
jgi:hypothetical protein